MDSVTQVHADVSRETRRLHVLHADRLACKEGCGGCCVDDISVFEVEAEQVRLHHSELLAHGVPHAPGACAFLDADDSCRIYASRPYVCRTQGLPLRWIEEQSGGVVEVRDICPLNDAGVPVVELEETACWSIGPVEERLSKLELASQSPRARVRLRDLFAASHDV